MSSLRHGFFGSLATATLLDDHPFIQKLISAIVIGIITTIVSEIVKRRLFHRKDAVIK